MRVSGRPGIVRLGALAALAAAIALVPAPPAAYGGAALAALAQPGLERVVLGGSSGLTRSVFIAMERGYFAQEGIQVELENFRTPVETAPGLGTGQLDVGLQGVGPALYNLIARGTGVRVVVDSTRVHPAREYNQTWLVTRVPLWESGQVRGAGDLRSRRVGLAVPGGIHELLLERILRSGGLRLDDVEIVSVPFPDMLPALANGAIDVAVEAEPFVTAGTSQGMLAEVLAAGDVYPNQQIAILAYSQRFAQERSDVARRWMVANLRGIRDLTDAMLTGRDRDQIVRIIAQYAGLDAERLPPRAALNAVNPDGYPNMESMLADLDWFAARGQVPQRPDTAGIVDNSFVDHALTVLGPYSQRP